MFQTIVLRLLTTVIIGVSAASAQADSNPLRLDISAGASADSVDITLTNQSAESLSVLRWNTPFESELSENVFSITQARKGLPRVEVLTYIGRHVKRSAPDSRDFLQLAPGASTSATVQLNEYYEVESAGFHGVQFIGEFQYSESGAVQLRSGANALQVTLLNSDKASIDLTPAYSQRVRQAAYSNCSAQDQTDIVAASEVAQQLVQTAVADLNTLAANDRISSTRYGTWFGSYDDSRYGLVTSNLSSIGNVLANESLDYYCDCDEPNTFAFVYANEPYGVHLCPEFRLAPVDGTNSRAGTIIHELSHFTVVAGTEDHAYSHDGTTALAVADPAKAIDNADNYEYFAENTPYLPMLGDGAVVAPNDGPVQNPPSTAQGNTLALNTLVSGSLRADEYIVYEVSGANYIELQSLSGDADLYIFNSPGLDDSAQVCEANALSADSVVDSCTLSEGGVLYVAVAGYTQTSYTIYAAGNATPGTSPGAIGAGPANDEPVYPFGLVSGGGGGGGGGGALDLWGLTAITTILFRRRRSQVQSCV
ncbi:MAG: M35 family metallo-endopeptidase [Granulosicoccus sp.]